MNWTVFWVVLIGFPVAAVLACGAFWRAMELWWALGETVRERVLDAGRIAFCLLVLVGVAAMCGALWDEAGVP